MSSTPTCYSQPRATAYLVGEGDDPQQCAGRQALQGGKEGATHQLQEVLFTSRVNQGEVHAGGARDALQGGGWGGVGWGEGRGGRYTPAGVEG